MELADRRVKEQTIERPIIDTLAGVNPTQIRYGWNPFKDINLINSDGTSAPACQPPEIAGPDGRPIPNPFFRTLPKGQLLPFITFEIIEQSPSPDIRMSDGRPALIPIARTQPALHSVVMISAIYGRSGFTILQALQGLPQSQAFRIFKVVQPLDFPISQIVSELEFADERIDATEDIVYRFEGQPDEIIPCLLDNEERAIARKLKDQMLVGAETAYELATEELSATETSMINRSQGGKGKTKPDPHDVYLCSELERGLPVFVGEQKTDTAKIEQKLDYLVDKEVAREKDAEIERLKQENAALRYKQQSAETIYCAGTKADDTPCRSIVKNAGDYCASHMKQREGTNVS